MIARVEISLKKGIVDPEGKNITKSLNLLHFNEVKSARVIKTIEIELDMEDKQEAMKRVDEMCRRLLSNPVINDYKIEIVG